MGMDHVRLEYKFPNPTVDTSHDHFGIAHNLCVLCTRSVCFVLAAFTFVMKWKAHILGIWREEGQNLR
jgi:hypothetical protein